ncbi:NADP-dependent oxidoreductase [Actinomadura logoneensis]|uniref:NADP-dependent oxidoreductase n=1 Tax=Actinomadura logoneensis TaxID=2293572 RepID=A0A372JFK5_9ACTN|nr:NADP-dependent oxidoreductase [Actinomadura logoneensis]RFU38679.1 NADP-dependent oxidoreductase [Actinomadura logoneensis]
MSYTSREWRLVARPVGEPKPSDVAFTTVTLPDPEDGQVVVRNDFVSVDPYMRGRMNDVPSYVPPFVLDEPMTGAAVGTVVASGAPEVPVGTTVTHFLGWRDHALLPATAVRAVDPALAPPQAYLGVLGSTGLTAYAGLTEIAPVKEGDTVFVSGAAGAVGSVAGQIARRLGAARVVGSAGGPEKVRRLTETFGFDAGIDYRQGDLPGQLAHAAPDGVDVYFDNVGGDHLEAAIGAMNTFGRIALCGAISAYNTTELPPGPRNLPLAVGKRLTLRGMIVSDHLALAPAYAARAAGWLRDGSLVAEETVVDGIENAFEAFQAMMRGANTGKMLVRIVHD